MNPADILSRVSQIIGQVVGDEELQLEPSSTAADVDGWDSLTHVQIMVAIERAFGIRFRTGEMASLANVGELVERITSRLPAAT
jgi:acyl carrier protein